MSEPGSTGEGLRSRWDSEHDAQRCPGLRLLPDSTLVWGWTHASPRFGFSGIRDVSKWSEKARKPLEALYGYDYFAKTCEKWVDGINQFRHLPDGMSWGLMVPSLIAGHARFLPLTSQHSSMMNKPAHYPHTAIVWTETLIIIHNMSPSVISVNARPFE